ncbi:MAG: hypothetical protein ACOYL6_12030 [Bacteriovoracaceae bacterium]
MNWLLLTAFALSTNLHGRVVCQGSTNELPHEQVFQKNGFGEVMAAVDKSTNTIPFKQVDIDATCEAICSNNKEIYYDMVNDLMSSFSGSREDKIAKFHKEYFYQISCKKGDVDTCVHKGDNIFRTSISDHVPTIIDELLKEQKVDLFAPDPVDNKSTLQWVKEKCSTTPQTKETIKTYYCNQAAYIECYAYKNNPAAFAIKPSLCGDF